MTVSVPIAGSRFLRQGRVFVAALGCCVLADGFLYGAILTVNRPTRSVVWGALALALYSGALLCLISMKRSAGFGFTTWSLGSWILLWYGIAFGLATTTWSAPQNGAPTEIMLSSVLRALWLAAVGITGWALGYLVGVGPPIQSRFDNVIRRFSDKFGADVRGRATPWILYVVGVAARIASAATTGRFGYVGDASSAVTSATGYDAVLSLISLCAPLAVAAAALQVFREHVPGARLTLAILFLTEFAFGAAAGGKQNFVVAVLAVAIPFAAGRKRLPKAALIGLILVFLVIIIPFNQAYRSAARSGVATLSYSQAISDVPAIARQTVTGHSLVTVIPDSIDYLLLRIREIDGPAIIIQRTPAQFAYISPAQLLEAPAAAVIPRALWPGKPILASGYQMSQEYYELPSDVYTSSAITPVGDLYRYGGWIPVVAGMFAFGLGVRLLDDALDIRKNPQAIFLILLLFPTLVKEETGWVQLIATIPSIILLWLLTVCMTFRLRKPTRAEA